ncbi:HicB family protein [Christensenellaceae bacterium]|nr:HicB family protein [Christensenellaceae bacterium]BDF60145.1 HicB family protein [Christensenellaceae bacterium]
MKYVYTAIFEPQESGGYLVRVPDVLGCVTSGKDITEAMELAKDALAGCLCSAEDHGYPIATSTLPGALDVPDGAFAALIDVDTNQYRAETDNRSVRKNVSIPAWMETRAERAGISLSQTLQEALRKKIG